MSIIQAVVLGIVQGLTEFLPVSSSGHLVLLQRLIGFEGPDILFDTYLHVGTVVAVCVAFRRDLHRMGRSLILRDVNSPEFRLVLFIVLGTIPTAVIGFLFRDVFEMLFSAVIPAALMLLVTGILLYVADRVVRNGTCAKMLTKRDACLIGLAQGLSIIPGLSRSGTTISTGIFLGLERTFAARFSFLLSIPAIAGAGLVQGVGLKELQGELLLPFTLGTVTAAVTGYGAIKILLRVVARRRLSFFSAYCWIVGGGVLVISLIRIFV